MPSPTASSCLLRLCSLGALSTPVWLELTGVSIRFDKPESNVLPKGWTAEDFSNVLSFYRQYEAVPTEEERSVFASTNRGTVLPGRKLWQKWAAATVKRCKINERIADILSSENCHPTDVEEDVRSNGAVSYLGYCLDDITLLLFGVECMDMRGRTLHLHRSPIQALAVRTWQNLVRRISRAQSRFDALEIQVAAAFAALGDSKLTKGKISNVIRVMARWRDVSTLINTPETSEKVDKMQAELDRLLLELGADTQSQKRNTNMGVSPRLFSISKEVIATLATEKNVEAILNLYREAFEGPSTEISDAPVIQERKDIPTTDNIDAGVERESQMDPVQLAARLGFNNGLPFLFNTVRRLDGLNPWSSPDAFDATPDSQQLFTPLTLHWHQLAGVHASISASFSDTARPDDRPGVLISDEVGLGKTYQAATIIAFLADAVLRQRTQRGLPPILNERPYIGDTKDIPELPHLLIIPGTLLSQWLDEMRILFAPQGIDILVYPTSKQERVFFWGPGGPFKAIANPLSSVIILVTQSVLQKEFSELHMTKAAKGTLDLPWAPRPLNLKISDGDVDHSLFGHKFLTGVVDEAHTYRNHGAKHNSILALLALCRIRIPLTATPLLTATKDLAAMGRLTGISHFFSEQAWEEEKLDGRELRQAQKELPDGYDSDNDEDDHNPYKLKQIEISRRMQSQSEGRVIRRSTDSLNWRGEVLVPLPDLITHYAYLDLTPREVRIITANGEAMQDNVGMSNMSSKLATRGFYIEYRTSVMFAREDPDDDIPHFDSLSSWDPVKSTKLDTAARICRYLLIQDDLPMPKFVDGGVQFADVPVVDNPTQTVKIVVFSEFPSMISLFINVFGLYNINVLAVNGAMTFAKRAAVIEKFKTDPNYRVLALSSVGTTGINLAFCRIIIFLDQPWSAQDVRQMTGRVHRQPQKHTVHAIHLLANETADVLVSGMAEGKRDMMKAFLCKKAGQDLFDLLSGGCGNFDSDDEDSASTMNISTGTRGTPSIGAQQTSSNQISHASTVGESVSAAKTNSKEKKKQSMEAKREEKEMKAKAKAEEKIKKREAAAVAAAAKKAAAAAAAAAKKEAAAAAAAAKKEAAAAARNSEAPNSKRRSKSRPKSKEMVTASDDDRDDVEKITEPATQPSAVPLEQAISTQGPTDGSTQVSTPESSELQVAMQLMDIPAQIPPDGHSMEGIREDGTSGHDGETIDDGMDLDTTPPGHQSDASMKSNRRPNTPENQSTLGKRGNNVLTPLSSRRKGVRFNTNEDDEDDMDGHMPFRPLAFPSVAILKETLPVPQSSAIGKPPGGPGFPIRRDFLVPRPGSTQVPPHVNNKSSSSGIRHSSGLTQMLAEARAQSGSGNNPSMSNSRDFATQQNTSLDNVPTGALRGSLNVTNMLRAKTGFPAQRIDGALPAAVTPDSSVQHSARQDPVSPRVNELDVGHEKRLTAEQKGKGRSNPPPPTLASSSSIPDFRNIVPGRPLSPPPPLPSRKSNPFALKSKAKKK